MARSRSCAAICAVADSAQTGRAANLRALHTNGSLLNLPVFLAQTQAAGSPLVSYLFLGGMVALMYFFMIRPQRNRAKAQQQLTSSLELGDKVTTIGGLHGVIRALDETSVVIELEQGRVRVERRAIASRRNSTS